ncbi:MAG: FeoA domain-containing protein [Pirellulaceae bacterium]
MTVGSLIPLKLLAPGQSARISQLVGLPSETQRLEELGLRAGAEIEMVQSGSPCIIRLNGHKLCFRDCDVFQVLVSPGDAA